MTTQDFEALASQYGLDVDFVHQLHEKVVDKENFARAVKMFADGTLPFDVATGDAPINVASIRHDVAVNMWNARKIRAERVKEQMEMQRRIVEYYNGCKRMTMARCTPLIFFPMVRVYCLNTIIRPSTTDAPAHWHHRSARNKQ